MKRNIILLLALLSASVCPAVHAQENTPVRTFFWRHSMEPFICWSNQIDSITFVDEDLDLSVDFTLTPIPDQVGKAGITVTAGEDARYVKALLVESYRVRPEMTELDLLAALASKEAFTMEIGKEYTFEGLQRKQAYSAILAAGDRYQCLGTPVRKDFTMIDYPLLNDPKVEVRAYDITQQGFKVDITPNDACKGYYFIAGEIDPRVSGGMDLRACVVAWGANWQTRKAHTEPTVGFEYTDFLPGHTVPVYVVMEDANGQYSDVITTQVQMQKKGTDKEAKLFIDISEITETSARIKLTPDENTSVYRQVLMLKSEYDKDPRQAESSLEERFNEPPSMMNPFQVEPDDYVWRDLTPGTEYYIVVRAKNANLEWGSIQKQAFTTLKSGTRTTQAAQSPAAIMLRGEKDAEQQPISLDIRR